MKRFLTVSLYAFIALLLCVTFAYGMDGPSRSNNSARTMVDKIYKGIRKNPHSDLLAYLKVECEWNGASSSLQSKKLQKGTSSYAYHFNSNSNIGLSTRIEVWLCKDKTDDNFRSFLKAYMERYHDSEFSCWSYQPTAQ